MRNSIRQTIQEMAETWEIEDIDFDEVDYVINEEQIKTIRMINNHFVYE